MDVQIPCPCPERAGALPHPDGDTVTLRDRLDFRSALAIRNNFLFLRSEEDVTPGEATAALSEGYLLFGIESWTLVDEKGKPLPVSRSAIRSTLLTRPDVAIVVADVADGLYSESTILPLVRKAVSSSPPTPTSESTSPTTPRSTEPEPMPSSPSSTSTTPTDATATMSPAPAGASSS